MDKTLKKLIRKKYNCLVAENNTFESIYNEMFSERDLILAETNDGFRIKKYTYGEIADKIERTASALSDKIGEKHEYIGLEMDNCVEWIICFWSILKSGNKPYLINMRHPKNLSQSIVEDLKITNIICMNAGELDCKYIEYKSIGEKNSLCTAKFEDEIAISSSATSLNETICFYNGYSIAKQLFNAEAILKESKRMAAHYKGNLKQLAFLPFYHIFGLTAVYMWFTFFNRTIVFLKDYSADTILQTCRKHKVTHIFAVPLLWHTVERQLEREINNRPEKKQKAFYKGLVFCTKLQNLFPMAGADISQKIMHEVTDSLFGQSVKFCISGGSRINDSTLKLFNGLGYPLHNGFGMSEIGITSVELRMKPKDRNKNSVGKPFESIDYTVNKDGTLTVSGESLANSVMINGVRKPLNGKMNTGDIFNKDEDGYYYITGRQSDAVIGENGENINPDEIEKKFSIPDATAFSVLGLDSENGERLSMIVQINRYLSSAKLSNMIDNIYSVSNTLPSAFAIRDFYITYDAIAPATAIKVGRKYLKREIEQDNITLTKFSDIAVNKSDDEFDINIDLVKRVCEIIAPILGVDADKIDLDAHLIYDLGASSMQYFSMLTLLAKEFNITSYSDKEQCQYTVKEFCKFIERYM